MVKFSKVLFKTTKKYMDRLPKTINVSIQVHLTKMENMMVMVNFNMKMDLITQGNGTEIKKQIMAHNINKTDQVTQDFSRMILEMAPDYLLGKMALNIRAHLKTT